MPHVEWSANSEVGWACQQVSHEGLFTVVIRGEIPWGAALESPRTCRVQNVVLAKASLPYSTGSERAEGFPVRWSMAWVYFGHWTSGEGEGK